MPIPKFALEYPELDPVFRWPAFNEKAHFKRRVLVAEVLWTLKLDGPIDVGRHGGSAVDVLLDRLHKRGAVALDGLTKVALSTLLAMLGGEEYPSNTVGNPLGRGTKQIDRRVVGRRTIHLSLLADVALPPNPFQLLSLELPEAVRRTPRPVVTAAAPILSATPASSTGTGARGRVLEDDEADRVKALLKLEAETIPAPDPPAVPTVDPFAALLDDAAGSGTMAEKCLAMIQMAGGLYTEALLREAQAALAPEPIDVVEATPELDQVKARLATTLEQAETLRRQVRSERERREAAENAHRATQAVLQSTKAELALATRNLAAIAKGERTPDLTGFKELRSMMQEKPRVSVG